MAKLGKLKSSSSSAIDVLDDLIPAPQLFPDEDPATYDGVRKMLFTDLAPGTPYERASAQNLVDLKWVAQRHRRLWLGR